VEICTFSPCIEQVQRTVSAMRRLGWVGINMVEVSNKRLEIRRERIGIMHPQAHGAQATAANVQEAVDKLYEVENRFKSFHKDGSKEKKEKINPNSKAAIMQSLLERKAYKEGKLTHKTEPEVKTHTSYLVFATLPMEWSEEKEAAARAQWPVSAESLKENASNRQKKPRTNGPKEKKSGPEKVNGDAAVPEQAAGKATEDVTMS
jgi:tRNA (adenine57-N1/adenine58-N1)-methyltransferase